MRVRRAEPEDAETVAKEFWKPLAEMMAQYSELNKIEEDAVQQGVEGFRNLIGEEDSGVLLLEKDEEEIGFLSFELGERETKKRGNYLSVNDLYIKEGYRGESYGTRLMEEAESIAVEERCDFVKVAAEYRNSDAREFYKDRGYDEKQAVYTKELG